jgi:hypothetical protein
MGQLRQGAGDSRNFLGLDFSGDSGDLGEISWSYSRERENQVLESNQTKTEAGKQSKILTYRFRKGSRPS